MTKEEWAAYLASILPAEIDGGQRPAEPIPTDLDFSAEFPQFIANDDNWYEHENAFLRQIFSNDKLLKTWIDNLSTSLSSQDFRIVTTALKGFMSPEMLAKLNGIAEGANNYVHPASHPATMITQDASNRFVSDAEKATWNGKASTAVVSTSADGLCPKRTGTTNQYLRADGTWQIPPVNGGDAASVGGYTAAQLLANAGGIVAASLAQNGYVKFSNGLILQWGFGTYSSTQTGSMSVAFPIAFPTAFLDGVCSGSGRGSFWIASAPNTGMVYAWDGLGYTVGGSIFRYFVIGL